MFVLSFVSTCSTSFITLFLSSCRKLTNIHIWVEFQLKKTVFSLSFRCGKTTICQLFAAIEKQKLYSVNCHMHSESSDFLGGLRPARSRTDEAEVK